MKNRYDFNGQVIALTCGNCEDSMEINHVGHMTGKSVYHFHCVNDCGVIATVHWFNNEEESE